MALPVVAVVGRSNVGKSTFVNRICQSKQAIVHSTSGVTRDRSYHNAEWSGQEFSLIDTGGIDSNSSDSFQGSIRTQAQYSINEADVILFLVDLQTGINADDEDIAKMLRRTKKPVFLVVNKVDNPSRMEGIYEYYSLGLGDPWPISSLHGTGTGDLLDAVVDNLKQIEQTKKNVAPMSSSHTDNGIDYKNAENAENATRFTDDGVSPVSVAIIGKPNAGKSSLCNKLCESERSIVSDVAGTTRDAIDMLVQHEGRFYTIVDTAGLRKAGSIKGDIEYYSYIRAKAAIERADVCLIVVDSSVGVSDQDKRLANYAVEQACAIAIVLNKWDLLSTQQRLEVRSDAEEKLHFVNFAPMQAVSALSGKNLNRIWKLIDTAYAGYSKRYSTSKLNAWLAGIREEGHVISKGKRVLRMKYVTQTAVCPPSFTFFVNRPDIVTDNYMRFLENNLRKHFDFTGTPIVLRFRKKD